ncbi:hypothetical protein [Nocardia panacis]|uniref:hypothetical protein n=1 Tax=Nocardia panacis TaxID=2340916 RepID=UPI0011C3A88F|nr:hypothetical protein [Nocardia panacis]
MEPKAAHTANSARRLGISGTLRGFFGAAVVLGGIGAAGLILGLPGCARDESSGGALPVGELTTGRCVDGLPAERPGTVTARSCTEPHDAEVVYQFDLPPGPWPGEIEITRQINMRCAPSFSAAMQRNRGGRPLRNYCVHPLDSADWVHTQRISCLVMSRNGEKLTAPVLG